ncbi:transmembrane protein 53-B-like [Littorina saxatilis]|uniref:transmembrane protein 53-B-like n=1 Tax=Littorina saxatilis TaxID=31220 RepID=UPI0038B68894
MAVVVLRQTRHLLIKELSALSTTPQRFQSGLPPVKTRDINSTLQLRCVDNAAEAKPRPLAVLFGWMMAKKRHLNKYGNLYLSKGFDVLTIQVPPLQVLWPASAQERIISLLDTLQDSSLASRPLLIHGFSVGGYLYGEMLVKLEMGAQKYNNISERIVGQVFDSPVDFEGVPRGFASVLAKNDAMKTALRNSLESYLKIMHNSVTKYYLQSSAAFHGNSLRLPSLFLYSRADPIGVADIIEGIIDKWRSQQIPVSHKCWDHSPHVSHFHHHPDEYVETLLAFLESLGLSTPERQETEQEKDLLQQNLQQQQQQRQQQQQEQVWGGQSRK